MLSVLSPEYFMKVALQQAERAMEEGEVPIGAVVVCKGKIIAKAWNQTERLKDVTAHAEMLAITSASNELQTKFLDDCELYVTLEPCPMCASALYWARFGKLYFAASDQKRGMGQIKSPLLHPKTKVFKGLLSNESEDLLHRFFDNLRSSKNN